MARFDPKTGERLDPPVKDNPPAAPEAPPVAPKPQAPVAPKEPQRDRGARR